VTGDPGIGKTTLLEAWLTGLQAQDVWIGRGQCSAHDGPGEAYLPLLEALGRLGRGAAQEPLGAVLRQHAPSWLVHLPALLAPGEWETLQRTVGPVVQPRMLRELADAVDVLTAERPLVLVLEDLHWSDRATLAWLAYVARRPDPARLLILGTYRPGDAVVHAQPLQAILTELQQHGDGEELALDERSDAAVTASLAQRFGDPQLATALACVLHPHTQGNPLFLRAVVDELVRQQVVTRGPDGWALQAGGAPITAIMPAQLRALIDLQLTHCSPEEQTLLEAASVAGTEFTVAAVAAGLEHTADAVEARCAALAHQGRWLEARGRAVWPDGTVTAAYRFRHALYQEVVYQRLPAGRQSRWHARIGTRLAQGFGERAGDMAAALARHFLRGQLLPQAVQSLWQAGDQAVRRGAQQEAVTCYEQALHALEQRPTTPDTRAQAIDLRLALNEALFPLGAFQRLCDTLRAAERLAEGLGDHQRLGWVSEALSGVLRRIGRYEQAVGCAQQAVSLAVSLGEAAMQAWATFRLGQAAYFLGDYPGALAAFQQVLAAPPEPGEGSGDLVLLPAHARSWLVYCLTHCGGFVEGLVVGAEAVQLAATGDFPTSRCAAAASLGGLHLMRGALQHAIPLLEQSLADCQRWQDLDWLPECAASLGLAYALAGRLAEALPLLEQAVTQETAIGGGHASIWLPELSQAYLLAGRLEEARAHAERALALACARQERGFQAWALQSLGDIAVQGTPLEIAQAELHYRQALALADELGMRPLQAHCHRGLGTLYATTGQRGQAQAALSTAIALYQSMEMTFWLPEAEAVLAQVGGR
jgi:tetratricopeptide (TPR) repeat protein